MNKKDGIAVGLIVLLSIFIWVLSGVDDDKAEQLRITVDGKVFGYYDLKQNQDISIGKSNVCRIENKEVCMIEANCPDQICVHMKGIRKSGITIVCLPNKIVLDIVGTKEGKDMALDDISS